MRERKKCCSRVEHMVTNVWLWRQRGQLKYSVCMFLSLSLSPFLSLFCMCLARANALKKGTGKTAWEMWEIVLCSLSHIFEGRLKDDYKWVSVWPKPMQTVKEREREGEREGEREAKRDKQAFRIQHVPFLSMKCTCTEWEREREREKERERERERENCPEYNCHT